MKPKIHLVGGRSASFVKEVVSKRAQESNNDSSVSAALRGGEASALLEGFLATIIRAMAANAGVVRVLSPDGHQFRLISCSGLPVDVIQIESVVDANCGVCGKSAKSGGIESSDADFCRKRYGNSYYAESCKFVLAVPLVSANQKEAPTGVITLYFASEPSLTGEVERTLKSYAELMHIALKNVWQNQDGYQLSLLAERQSIANEIHDSLAQTLYFAKIRASLLLDAMKAENDLLAFKCAQDIDEALESSQKTVRELVTHFRCQMDSRGLKYALQKLVKDFRARSSITLEYTSQVEIFVLPVEYELQIFLIVREALVNAVTHSGASVVRLEIRFADGQYQIVIEDNGDGFASDTPSEGHHGLLIMRERALRIGGVVEVESNEGTGTRVQLIFSAPVA